MKKAIIIASVSSMIKQFNIPNIEVLLDLGYEVSIACNFEEGTNINNKETIELKQWFEENKINYHQIDFPRKPSSISQLKKSYNQLKELVLNEEYHLMHCHAPVASVISRLVFKKYSPDTHIIYTAHGFHFYQGAPLLNWLIFYPIEKHFSRYTDTLITINKEDYKLAQKKFRAKKVEYVPGVGVDLDVFNPISDEDKKRLRKKYGFKEEDFILIYVAELNDNKNQSMLISASAQLIKEISNLKVLLVGQGNNYEQYKSQIAQLNLNDVVFLLGYRQDIPDLLRISDVSVSTSQREGLPVNILESMAVGNPIVATDCRGNRDLVRNGHNGFIVPSNDIGEMFSTIKEFYGNWGMKKKMEINNLRIIQNYSSELVRKTLKNIYQS